MRTLDVFSKYMLVGAAALAAFASLDTAHARDFGVLYSFTGGSDGAFPEAGLMKDKAGNLYGTTLQGGTDYFFGTVFELTPDGTETVLYSFTGGSDGGQPGASLVKNSGNLYGTTELGGSSSCNGGFGCGTVFEVAPDGAETVLHAFTGGRDGAFPWAGLLMDSAGNLYGTTVQGGNTSCNDRYGCGTVFKLAPDGTESVLHSFCSENNCTDGYFPLGGGLIEDSAGNLYGTTNLGGRHDGGIIFEIAPDGTETVLHSFGNSPDGGHPFGGLIKDSAGNFYGTTTVGGSYDKGTVFELAPDGSETVLYSFKGGSDGDDPYAALIEDKAGNLYGTTEDGGVYGRGTVFKLKE